MLLGPLSFLHPKSILLLTFQNMLPLLSKQLLRMLPLLLKHQYLVSTLRCRVLVIHILQLNVLLLLLLEGLLLMLKKVFLFLPLLLLDGVALLFMLVIEGLEIFRHNLFCCCMNE
ncbi:MAG: hypothetical protein JOS17DRAFT_761269 [Linnemannia elongata]|nr:MAG: hypothetical protein JOS17DRAFT_761269 [Linnemannia elongata]